MKAVYLYICRVNTSNNKNKIVDYFWPKPGLGAHTVHGLPFCLRTPLFRIILIVENIKVYHIIFRKSKIRLLNSGDILSVSNFVLMLPLILILSCSQCRRSVAWKTPKSNMDGFATIANGFQPSNIVAKLYALDVYGSPSYSFAGKYQTTLK